MTLSSHNSSPFLSTAESLLDDDHATDIDGHRDEVLKTSVDNDAQLARQPLIDHIDNSDAQHEDVGETEAEQDNEVVTEDAKAPESQITMTSPSPDVVIATVETPEIEEKFDEAVETQRQAGAKAVKNNADEQNSNDNNSEAAISAEPINEDSISEDSIGKSGAAENSLDNKNPASQKQLDSEAYPTEEEKQEAVEKEKESKLESYKQFIAEQFSNQKVDYPEVRVKIEANALPSKMYFIMNVLSAIIASYGLVANSAAVVIGAMLVAMMLGPITGIALAIIDHRMPLLRKSLFTVTAGVSLVVLVGFIVGWLHNEQPLTAEILSRTQPTSMDLMIALAGGTAGAYAMVSPHLSVAVVGVAVATALVPPLAASGILFANGEMQLGLGALLLAITNIIAIQFTNALVLWLLGFRRLVDDDYKTHTFYTFCRRNAVTLLLLAGLGTYLTINLNKNANQQTFENNVKTAINNHFINKGNVLTNTQFDNTGERLTIRAVIRGETTPSSYDVRQIEALIVQDMADNFSNDSPIKLQLRYVPVQVIESNPLIADKLDKTDAAILTN
ncbi:TIGR00341 family protein [uncultured Psychrobacter sp.]|uniref:TIGR00341 family protein n=1 Tax=uncultured Psychrobacter sp. TaxID=259303 RepID=UPI0034590433